MRIAITIPSFDPHGRVRVVMEWANRLSLRHDVVLLCRRGIKKVDWFDISPKVKITSDRAKVRGSDCLIICSPHDIDLDSARDLLMPKFLFMQMLEHMFRPCDEPWLMKCDSMYKSKTPLILISEWNKEFIQQFYPQRGPVYCVGNGVNLDHFPLEPDCFKKNPKTVLIEGWNSLNPTKDVDRIGPKVAVQLRDLGYRILAFSQKPLTDYVNIPHEFYCRPSLSKMNDLYRQASVLVKASRYDARSCAPVEAMTKGTVTARAVTKGDDDLENDVNCLKHDYHEEGLLADALFLLKNDGERNRLSQACLDHAKANSWDHWMPKIESIIK